MKNFLNKKISVKMAIVIALLFSFLTHWEDLKDGFIEGWSSSKNESNK